MSLLDEGQMGPVDDNRKAALDVLNKAREGRYVRPLVLSDDLNSQAERWARHLASLETPAFHSDVDSREEDEHIAILSWLEKYPMKAACEEWVGKMRDGVQEYQRYQEIVSSANHFFGIAAASSRLGRTYVVARYASEYVNAERKQDKRTTKNKNDRDARTTDTKLHGAIRGLANGTVEENPFLLGFSTIRAACALQ